MSLASDKRGIVDLSLYPVMTIGVAALVIVVVLLAIQDFASSTDLEKGFYAIDTSLVIDSLYAIRPDVNLYVDLLIPSNFGVVLRRNEVSVYDSSPKDAKKFWFTQDSDYGFHYTRSAPETRTSAFRLSRIGADIGALEDTPLRVTPTCDTDITASLQTETAFSRFSDLSKQPVQIVSGDIAIWVFITRGPEDVRIYTDGSPASEEASCHILHSLFQAYPDLKGYAALPLNPALLARNDPRRDALVHSPGLYISLSLSRSDSASLSLAGQAIHQGVQSYAQ